MFHVKHGFSCIPDKQHAMYIRRWLWNSTKVIYRGHEYDPRRNPKHFDLLFNAYMENRA